jgi:hypothetical protein
MKHVLTVMLLTAFISFPLSSCGKKTDASGMDSTKAVTEATKAAPANPGSGKYPIKSGIIHGESETMGMKGTTTKYFDDYGAKIREESSTTITMGSTSTKTNHVSIIKDGWMYSFEPEKKTGMKMKYSIPANMDYKNMSEKMMKDYGVKEAGTETILGKECKIYEYSGAEKGAMTGKAWIFWNVEAMKMDMKVGEMTMKTNVTSIEENTSIPSDKFEVPADIKMREMDMNMPHSAGGK